MPPLCCFPLSRFSTAATTATTPITGCARRPVGDSHARVRHQATSAHHMRWQGRPRPERPLALLLQAMLGTSWGGSNVSSMVLWSTAKRTRAVRVAK